MIRRREFLRLSLASLGSVSGVAWGEVAGANSDAQDVVFLGPSEQGYKEATQLFNSRHVRVPKLVAICFSTRGVQLAVKRAGEQGLPIAVKSGGHSFEAFCSNDGGMMISLAMMRQLQYSATSKLLVAQPGAKLAELYDKLIPLKRILPAGSCGGVGLGGLTLGGGYGLFAREYGLTCDHLLEATMVDGGGNIVSTKQDRELLSVLRGGGNGNFGVVTSMVFKTHGAPTSMVSKNYKWYKLSKQRASLVLQEWFAATARLPNDAFSAFVLNGRHLTILVTFFKEESRAKVFAALEGISKLCDRQYKSRSRPLRSALKLYYGRKNPLPFKNASAGYYRGFEQMKKAFEESVSLVFDTPGMVFQVNTLGGAIANDTLKGTSLYPHREFPYLGELQTYWSRDSQAEKCLRNFKLVQSIFSKNGINEHYRNYPDIDFVEPMKSYYGKAGTDSILAMKTRYDSGNRFQYAQLKGSE